MLGSIWLRTVALRTAALVLFLISLHSAMAQPAPIKIGLLNDQAGPNADITGPGSVVAAQMAIEDFGGKLLDRPIELLVADHQNKPDVGSAIAGRWLDEDGVQAIIDVPYSSVMLAVQDVVRRKSGILLVAGAAATQFNGKACHPYGFQWIYDTYALAKAIGTSVTQNVGKTWFIIQVDYAFGESMTSDLRTFIGGAGGRVLGVVKHPADATDFSSYILQAQASGAEVIALVNAGASTINSIKQATDFGVGTNRQRLTTALLYLSDARALGLDRAQGLSVVDGFYWDVSAQTREFSKRFAARFRGRMPTSAQISLYSALGHYLKAVQTAGTLRRDVVADRMRSTPVEDIFVTHGRVRSDGLMEHDLLLLDIKTPAESTSEWDLFKVRQVIPAASVFRPLAESECPLVKH